jgi:hypothetical protein
MQKRIAMLYDFDYTLAHGFMQQFGLMQEFGYDDVIKFFQANDAIFDNPDLDMCLSLLGGVLHNRVRSRPYWKKIRLDRSVM